MDLALSDERRDELVALLNDEARLRTEYPTVADYLNTAPTLRGTGDDQADAAFDLRFVHYATGGTTQSSNPYWDIVAPSISEHNGRRLVNGGNPTGSARLGYAQMALQAIYAYAIPSPETLTWVADFCGNKPMVELGAGRGYWAAQLSALGIAVDAFDSEPPNKTDNVSFPSATTDQTGVWAPVGDLEEFSKRVTDRSGHVLFLCWPPGWGDTMASQALVDFEKSGGDRLVFIGEPKGGKTGDDAFFDGLSARWTLSSQHEGHVSWWNLNDVAQGWIKP